MSRYIFLAVLTFCVIPAFSCPASDTVAPDVDEKHLRVIEALRNSTGPVTPWPEDWPFAHAYNREAPVPPQCYTRHEGRFNPCYVCHQAGRPGFENIQNDQDLQAAYDFSDVGFTNHWHNLFEDRSERVEAIGDEDILDWVRSDNYSELAGRLRAAEFAGWIPDLDDLERGADAFDELGFALDDSQWVAFNYKPLPSTFWPTNGATDDVMIRLPESFRKTKGGDDSRDVYLANLALLELAIKHVDQMTCPPVDEAIVGVDLDQDGEISTAHVVHRRDSFVGAASNVPLYQTMYPQGTEFLHTVRYLDLDEHGNILPSRRIKEVRYMRRQREMRKSWAAYLYLDEMLDKEAGKLPRHKPLTDERALQSETGWEFTGFIEDAHGRLRVNTFEETLFCMGCHNSVGSTIDKTFSFARKMDGAAGWGYIDLRGMPDAPSMGESRGEIATYLQRVGGGSEFRHNDEMKQRMFDDNGALNEAALAGKNVFDLITPSPQRALELNKAYKVIVEDQDYVFGRDPTVVPPSNVYDVVDPDTAPTLPDDRLFAYDIRLDWSATDAPSLDPAPIRAGDTQATSSLADFDRDRAAILALAGTFRVDFHFRETVATTSGYELAETYDEDATEIVEIVADEGDFISLQHLLVVGDPDNQRVIKHWRQDWRYEDENLLVYRGERDWEHVKRLPEDVRGAWSQAVYQTNDSPRYEAIGRWSHLGERSSWESEETWRPMPRRDHTKRDDYDVIVARNRHTITPNGWVHEQDNRKLVLDERGRPQHVLAHEIGHNRYTRVHDESARTLALDFWRDAAPFWSDVRAAWRMVLDDADCVTIHGKRDGQRLSARLRSVQDDQSVDLADRIDVVAAQLSDYIESPHASGAPYAIAP